MIRFALSRLAIVAASLVAVSVVVFAILSALPGSPAQVILGTQATPEAVKQENAELGVSGSLVHQYLHWAGGLLTAHPGASYISHQPIGSAIGQALEVTGPLILLALAIGLIVALPLGVGGALYNGRLGGTLLGALSQIGIAVPTFVGGILLIIVFAVKTHFLPASGFPGWSHFGTALESLVLPAITLGLVEGAILSRYLRASVLDQLGSDYLRTARSKGLTRGQALRRHGLRNTLIPLLTVIGLELAGLIVGAIVVENVFDLPGLGEFVVQAVQNRDRLEVQDVVMLVAAVVLVINLAVELSYRLIDPRVEERA